jgi:hypothetical protein
VVSEWSALHLFFFMHVPDKIWVQEVGTQTNRAYCKIDCVEPEQQPMGDENKYDGVRYPFKMFLEESHLQQRNEMMDKLCTYPLMTAHRRSIFIKQPCNPLQGTGKF